jgi:hypothetical protein
LITLEAAQQGKSVLFLDEQELLFEGLKRGFVNSLTPKVAHMRPFFYELHSSLITSPIFVRLQHLIAQNVSKLFIFMFAVSHFYVACCNSDVSRGFVLGYEIDVTFGFGLP